MIHSWILNIQQFCTSVNCFEFVKCVLWMCILTLCMWIVFCEYIYFFHACKLFFMYVNWVTRVHRVFCLNYYWDQSRSIPSTVVHYLKGGARLTAEHWMFDCKSSLVCATRGMTTQEVPFFKYTVETQCVFFTHSTMLLMWVGLVYIRLHKH